MIEEIGRIIGYDNLPSAPLPGSVPDPDVDPERELGEQIRDLLGGLGLREIITYVTVGQPESAITSSSGEEEPAAVRLLNPMNTERDRMRSSLRPWGLRTFAQNQRESRGVLGLFEVGKTFAPNAARQPTETRTLLALLGGETPSSVHGEPPRQVDFYDAKGVLEQLGAGLGASFVLTPGADDALVVSGRSAKLSVGGHDVGVIGQVQPKTAEAFDVDGDVFALELSISALAPLIADSDVIAAPSVYPAAVEDLALIVDHACPAGELEAAITANGLVETVELFDIYTGNQIPAGQKSLASASPTALRTGR